MSLENPFLLSCKAIIRKRFPLLLSHAGRAYAKSVGFQSEKAFLKDRLQTNKELKSLVLLSCNRAATQFTEDVLSRIYESAGGKHVALNRYLFFAQTKEGRDMRSESQMGELLRPKGYFFGQQGPFVDPSFLKDYLIVAMVRDPRDLLVSHFYSMTNAHVPRDQTFVKRAKKARKQGLQAYVQEEEIISYFEDCLKQALLLKGVDGVLTYRYEDMMSNYTQFHEKCQQLVCGKVSESLSTELEQLYKQPVTKNKEHQGRHRRSGAWGQYKGELDADVIAKLNERFGPLLVQFGYDV